MLLTPVVVLFFLKAENNFCHFVNGAEAVDVVVVVEAEVLADEELPVVEGVVGVGVEDVVVGGVEKVTLWVDGDEGGWSPRCCCCCRG